MNRSQLVDAVITKSGLDKKQAEAKARKTKKAAEEAAAASAMRARARSARTPGPPAN